MEDDLTVLHYQFFLIRGHMFRGGNYGAGVGIGGNVMGFFIV